MRYLLSVILMLWATSVFAEEETEENIRIIHQEEDYDIDPDVELPDCNNPKLVEEVRSAISEHLAEHNSGSIVEQRKRKLILKSIDQYSEVEIAKFDNKQNYDVADELIMTKINRRIKEKNMRLCVSEGKKKLYLLIYPEDFRYQVQVIGFIPRQKEGNAFSIFYTPEVAKYEEFKN